MTSPITDVMVDVEFKLGNSQRRNIGIILRSGDEQSCLILRHYDRDQCLELLGVEKGVIKRYPSRQPTVSLVPGEWYRFRVVAIQNVIMAKTWPASQKEPSIWHLSLHVSEIRPGLVGLFADDGSKVSFRNFHAVWDKQVIAEFQAELAREEEKLNEHTKKSLELSVETTPFVLRTDKDPQRLMFLVTTVEGVARPIAGDVTVSTNTGRSTRRITAEDFANGKLKLTVPEPQQPSAMEIIFDSAIGKTLRANLMLQPARPWTFYMTPHTHFDVGFTDLQPAVIKKLSDDMDSAVRYCKETANWPEESRYRWVVEVSALMKNYIDRHSKEQIDEFMNLVRQGRIEVCAYYLNMPTELVGHEELIRCLYYAESLRRQYGIPIDTAMLNDVPGYGWALPELFVETGIHRGSFRANSIHGQFLWYRENAAKRPFYWQGPEGSRVFLWYTDSYREGNFFREPGLHEDSFLSIIARNEAAGCTVDDIQLRMGGDNLPPDIDASRNTQAWNGKYIWPKVVVATNREFLEILEKKYGPECKTFQGDIPSWWAEGPASSAYETGMNRILHDKLAAAEALWTRIRLADPVAQYPHEMIHEAYDNMIYFDEHTWGASSSITSPEAEQTVTQWQWKANYAYKARELTDRLYDQALEHLATSVERASPYDVAVWNTLGWSRTDVVELDLTQGPLMNASSVSVLDVRSGKPVAVQILADHKTAYFIAENVPAMGYVRYEIKSGTIAVPPAATSKSEVPAATLENKYYRLTWSQEAGGLSSWYDKILSRELLDIQAGYSANEAIYETPLNIDLNDGMRGRGIIERKTSVQFTRTTPAQVRILSQQTGPVFTELTTTGALPTCPRIVQTVRLYHDLRMIDIANTVTKEEIYTPEGVYFAFPFAVDSPEFHVQIADAVMRPGKEQLPLSCMDFYSIQHWAAIQGDTFGIIVVPMDAPVVVLSDLNVYQWADHIDFNRGHIYSLVMNNYWCTNFRGGQKGELTFRYRLTSNEGTHDSVRDTRFAWQKFHPLQAVWLTTDPVDNAAVSQGLLRIEGDPVILSCLKMAENGEGIILRVLEQKGKPANCTITFDLPGGRRLLGASYANAVERPIKALLVTENTVKVDLRANEVVTIEVIPQPHTRLLMPSAPHEDCMH